MLRYWLHLYWETWLHHFYLGFDENSCTYAKGTWGTFTCPWYLFAYTTYLLYSLYLSLCENLICNDITFLYGNVAASNVSS